MFISYQRLAGIFTASLFFLLFVCIPSLSAADKRGEPNKGVDNQSADKDIAGKKPANKKDVSPLLSADKETKKLGRVLKEQQQNHRQAARSQKKVSALANETRDLVHSYRVILRQIEDAEAYNAQLKTLIKDQDHENHFIRRQIKEVKQTKKEVIPLMTDMLAMLEKFIEKDVPFLMEERKTRLKELKKIMNRADVTLSEKYRRLMEAYSIENEYGKTLETYHGIQSIDGEEVDVYYLRVGRVAFMYQTRDESRQAYWDQNAKKWVELPSRFKRAIRTGLKVARKQQAPELLVVPVMAPRVSKGARQ